jgi:hypothetical protein
MMKARRKSSEFLFCTGVFALVYLCTASAGFLIALFLYIY